MIIYKRIENTIENILKTEKLRYQVYGLEDFSMNDIEFKELEQCKKLIFAAFENDEIIAAAYVSDLFDSVYIDNLFVDSKYQNKGLKIGRNLLNFVLENKKLLEQHYNKKFDYSKIEYINDKTKAIYKQLGYDVENTKLGVLRKKI